MPNVLLHACVKSIPDFVRALFGGILYLSLMFSMLTLSQLLLKGLWPKTLSIGGGLLGNSLLFHSPIVIGLSVLWAMAWLAVKWKSERTPLF